MIAKLSGFVDSKNDDSAIVNVGGVGYLVFGSQRMLDYLPASGSEISLWIETHVREDHIHLYGFLSSADQKWFRLLTTVQGVGARVALAIQSALSADELTQAIIGQDKSLLTRASGVGPKLAARILTELKDKVSTLIPLPARTVSLSAPETDGMDGAAADALSALLNLGYRRAEAAQAVAVACGRLGHTAPLAELIRESLQELSR